jgi:hypothetical protein
LLKAIFGVYTDRTGVTVKVGVTNLWTETLMYSSVNGKIEYK